MDPSRRLVLASDHRNVHAVSNLLLLPFRLQNFLLMNTLLVYIVVQSPDEGLRQLPLLPAPDRML